MGPWSRASEQAKDSKKFSSAHKSFNVDEEYQSALRTESYIEFFCKAQLLATNSSGTPRSRLSEINMLLEPEQDAVPSILESVIFPKALDDLRPLILDYFDTSAEASRMCSQLLRSIHRTHSDYKFIQTAIEKFGTCSTDELELAIAELGLFTLIDNPFSNPNQHDFKLIHDRYSSIMRNIKLKQKKVAKRIKFINGMKNASGVGLTVACVAVTLVAIGIAAHSLAGLLMGPTLLGLSPFRLKKKINNRKFFRSRFLQKLEQQLDAVAKGTYILNRDFDTVGRLVARLHDEIEHNKATIRFCLDRREDKFPIHEVVKELEKCSRGLKWLIEEVEEHVCLCLVTINRARVLVIDEISAP